MSEWPAHWLRFATINTTTNPEVIHVGEWPK